MLACQMDGGQASHSLSAEGTKNKVKGLPRGPVDFLCDIFLSFQKASDQIFACQLLRITTIVAPFLIAPNLLLTNMICHVQLFSVFYKYF